ncbi:hypothetical protein J4573_04610 [Actinomadura barringtoniae]|uniref:Uncharacterized protein n=1 Tax=Actinomadura barringtoniae TaxID=1427535 RepID=A0A939P6K4_9ACTN|nr:hypothetical protein [Actinomadura barringtoniae]MBO2446360.1 hypothetical protein [Actinomadura barringtoniae]
MENKIRWLIGAIILLVSLLVGICGGVIYWVTSHSIPNAITTGAGVFAATALFIAGFISYVKQL